MRTVLRPVRLLAVAAALALALSGCGSDEIDLSSAAPQAIQGDGFSFAMRGEPVLNITSVDVKGRPPMPSTTYEVSDDHVTQVLNWVDYLDGGTPNLDELLDGSADASGGEPSGRAALTVDGRPARTVVLDHAEGFTGDVSLYVTIVQVGSRVFSLNTAAAADGDLGATVHAEVQNSLRFAA